MGVEVEKRVFQRVVKEKNKWEKDVKTKRRRNENVCCGVVRQSTPCMHTI
jgi:hypothetical protein